MKKTLRAFPSLPVSFALFLTFCAEAGGIAAQELPQTATSKSQRFELDYSQAADFQQSFADTMWQAIFGSHRARRVLSDGSPNISAKRELRFQTEHPHSSPAEGATIGFIRPASFTPTHDSWLNRELESLLLKAHSDTAQANPTPSSSVWTTIMSENFEGAFPTGKWGVLATSGYTQAYWDETTYRRFQGSRSAWCADGGPSGGPRGGPYPPQMNAVMVYGPFSLEDAKDAFMSFYFWNESETCCDRLFWQAAITDGSVLAFGGFFFSGSTGGWVEVNFDLTDVPVLGDLSGESEVFILFLFLSDESIEFEGAYVDNVLLRKFVQPIAVEEGKNRLPFELDLSQNYPNPFNPDTKFVFALPQAGEVKLSIYALTGQLVRELANSKMPAGRHEILWNGQDQSGRIVANGVYWYQLTVTDASGKAAFRQTKKMTMLK